MPTKITSISLADDAVTADKISAGAVTAAKVAEGVSGGPKISNVQITNNAYTVLDDTAVDTSGGYIKITGSGFASGCSVIIGSTAAASTTFISSSEVRAQVPAQSAGSYFVYVVNPDGGTATRVNGLTYSASPVWVTGSALANATSGAAYSQQLSATGASTYSLASGSSLPSGLTLSSGGLLSGTVTVGSNTSYSFTLNATDSENQDSPRTFNLNVLVESFIIATGGTVTTSGNYKIHSFTSDGTFQITQAGNPSVNAQIEYLIVGGGGKGGWKPSSGSDYEAGGGGGAGGVVTGTATITSTGNYAVTVGAGATLGNVAGSSIFNGITAYGGGNGGRGTLTPGQNGASGGGAAGKLFGSVSAGLGNKEGPGSSTNISGAPQGFDGGSGYASGNYDTPNGGGGGGAGGMGSAGSSGGNGGPGVASSITGTETYYGGGGGGARNGGGHGQGGIGGGGAAGNTPAPGMSGTGGGGGGTGGYSTTEGGDGGSGIVILRYRYQ